MSQGVVQVELVLLPAVSGDFGVMPGHVPTISQLRPGVVAVHSEVDKDVKKFFISGGFAFAHADSSVEIAAVEAVPVEELDPAAVKAGLAEYTARCDCAHSAASRARLVEKHALFYFVITITRAHVPPVSLQTGQRSWEE